MQGKGLLVMYDCKSRRTYIVNSVAGAVLAIIPVVVLFFIFQKYMMTGYSKSAMK